MEIPRFLQHIHDPGLSDHAHFNDPTVQSSPHFFEGKDWPGSPNGVHTTLTLAEDAIHEDEAFAVAETLQRFRQAGQVILFESDMGITAITPPVRTGWTPSGEYIGLE